uniref:ATP synthase F0 subunit 8 n=1 Tax=Bungarus fasciatus TaxID=8613 RepID=B6CWL1_BUNFA|nr:ATP synthase F0 subunit 8 [Bungarus fasciatus]ACB36669.1 ATP synthase F0 subunit 8 [Bungarus fasciatus]
MPQLSTTYIFLIYLWIWLMLYLTMQKINMMLMNKTPTNMSHTKPNKLSPTLPWT